ncbi:peroxiredoxin-like family protein [Jeotgalibacillus salarius]|uniref:thioredoxin-dependent peroxiredoxin n=1 Tax=Jeotgalibacillus salarius TaxID=546023 RepID=A0A4Y8LNP3_9BACL|nr:peroxiredoxin-like family protein [Jeotgalibacillus salarius]TFE04180.1 AhpC/TSA family protein [Jeotgalibacillus salarius]
MSTLLEEIKVYKETFKKKAPEEKQRLMAQATKELEESGIAQGLQKGDQIPDFTLPDAAGQQVSIKTLLAQGPVILTFYRGGWCPYCNLELKAYQNKLSDIKGAGAELVAISPETPDASLNTKEKNSLEYKVLSDVENKVADQFNLVFSMPDYLIDIYKDSGLDVAAHNGNDDWELPKPATFVIDSTGEILFAEVDADYTYRTPPEKVIEFVKSI